MKTMTPTFVRKFITMPQPLYMQNTYTKNMTAYIRF